jgi:ATP-dependent DNA helicase DinG
MALRFSDPAARSLRQAIAEAGGVEVFAIGDMNPLGKVSRLEIHCRGDTGAVPALLERPRAGQVVIHNHPSGLLRPSGADFALANRYGDEGIGVVIVDNAVENDFWVVEPARREARKIDRDRLVRFFMQDLPAILPGAESRPQQLEMAVSVADALDKGEVLVVEAGTGTGKSLAYLVPSILWALANDSKVAVSTYTRTLQGQLLSEDLPLVRRAGVEFRAALVKGRGNYLCRRKLEVALAEPGADAALLQRIGQWVEAAEEGSIQELGEDLEPDFWDRVESSSDQSLRARCPHYNSCFYYQARRRAAASHLLVLNHALLLADQVIKAQTDGDGILPRFGRVILDEGHHLEDAATSAITETLTGLGVRRAIAPLLPRKRRAGALQRIAQNFGSSENQLVEACREAEDRASELKDSLEARFDVIGAAMMGQDPKRRITEQVHEQPAWTQVAAPALQELCAEVRGLHDRLGAVAARLEQVEVPIGQAQPVMDLNRSARRLGEHGATGARFLALDDRRVRWIEQGRRSNTRLCSAPVEVGPMLKDLLFERMEAISVTSATLAIQGRFDHWMHRHGVDEARTQQLDSPFDYREQALLVLPRDLPRPDAPGWLDVIGRATVELVRASRGGAFVLCTSHAVVRALGQRLQDEVGRERPVLVQARGNRDRLLRRFRETEGAVLVGTDSFWEGVSVKGRALRMVIIPRLPFRVPTEPVAQARYELIERRGQNPFRAFALPEAVLKLRQGFGRLVRARTDRGVVAILDRRVHDMWYGRVFLHSLPPARRTSGPMRAMLEQVERFYLDNE